MNWQDIAANWQDAQQRLQDRFPFLDAETLRRQPSREEVIAHIAARHDLTPFEAAQELDDWLFSERLSQAVDRLAG
ncbi:hypothetical protein [Salipiger sp.]|uniref:hypothetical protein n=1 Tax=Salipiger sp. TaxID=2078585 RepID=UPI003A9724AA